MQVVWWVARMLSVCGVLLALHCTVLAKDERLLRAEAPWEYQVKEGDNLWEIASKFLHDPWKWKQIWHANPKIEDPHLIYPGDKLILSYLNGKPMLETERVHTAHLSNIAGGIIKLKPRMLKLPAERAIPTIPLEVIAPFLNDSRVITQAEVNCAPRVVALEEDHLVVGTGDYIYVSGLNEHVPDKFFTVFKVSKTYVDPKTKKSLGIEGLHLGKAQLEVGGDPARLSMISVNEAISVGDRITFMLKETIDPYFVPTLPQGLAKGQIISIFGGLSQMGQYQVVVITGGKDKQRTVGDVLGIYQYKKDTPKTLSFSRKKTLAFPGLRVGTLIVFRVFDQVSYGLVVDASRAIYLQDAVERP